MGQNCRACKLENPLAAQRCQHCGVALNETATRRLAPPLDETATRKLGVASLLDSMMLTEADDPPDPKPVAGPHGAPSVPRPGKPHFLIATILGEPVELHRDRSTRIGRSVDSDVVLALEQVSRAHAEVRYDGRDYWIIDLSSANGTFVNGKSVQKQRLVDQDRIVIGPFTLVYRSQTGGSAKSGEHDDSTSLVQLGALAGDLAEMSAIEALKALRLLKKTGELHVTLGDGTKAVVIVQEGRPLHAKHEMTTGASALRTLAKAKTGQFRFDVKPVNGQLVTLSGSLEQLLGITP